MHEKVQLRKRVSRWSAALFLIVGGCVVGPNYQPPATELPEGFSIDTAELPAHPTSQPVAITEWWATLNDAQLNDLVRRAVASNLDLKQAAIRLREARARRSVVTGRDYPTVDMNTSYARERMSATADPFGAVAGEGIPLEYDLWQVGFDATWEIDIFGGNRRAIEAANADLQGSIEDRRDVLMSIIAEVTRNYVELRADQRRLEVASQNLATQRETLEVTRNMQSNGLATQFDVSRAAAQASATEAEIPRIEQQIAEAKRRIAVLLGEHPSSLNEELSSPAGIPAVEGAIPVGLPSTLLRRRPDIRRAERQIAAATARVGVAVADLYPKFSLTGSAGLQTSDLGELFDWDSRYFTIMPGLRWHIFDAGQYRAIVRLREAQQEGALVSYQQTVLNALREVEDDIGALRSEQQRRGLLRQSVQAYRDAVEVAQDLYRQGLTDFLTVLDAQRSLFAQEEALVRSEQAVTIDVIALYKALGGGWEMGDKDSTIIATGSDARTVAERSSHGAE